MAGSQPPSQRRWTFLAPSISYTFHQHDPLACSGLVDGLACRRCAARRCLGRSACLPRHQGGRMVAEPPLPLHQDHPDVSESQDRSACCSPPHFSWPPSPSQPTRLSLFLFGTLSPSSSSAPCGPARPPAIDQSRTGYTKPIRKQLLQQAAAAARRRAGRPGGAAAPAAASGALGAAAQLLSRLDLGELALLAVLCLRGRGWLVGADG
jgi:hypothetical protein